VISLEPELTRIRELTRQQRHAEALTAAAALDVGASREVLYLVAANQRCLGRIHEALATLERLEQQHPRFSRLYQERGHCYLALREAPRAIAAFQEAVSLNTALPTSWTLLERLYRMLGDTRNADTAAEHVATLRLLPTEVVQAGTLFCDGDLAAAENTLRGCDHVEALRLLARIKHQHQLLGEAERLLEVALTRDPGYRAARLDYIRVLIDRQKYLRAREVTEGLFPEDAECLSLRGTACAGLGDHEAALALHRDPLTRAHSLRALGRYQEAIEAYHGATNAPEAWWGLANLKTYRFSDQEIERMRAADEDHHLCFALGKAFEDRSDFAQSWHYYERGNALKRAQTLYRPEFTETNTAQQIAACTAELFATRAGFGSPAPDPIFIVGLPR
jgi:tetratricopeptide (TPR) repeat protein